MYFDFADIAPYDRYKILTGTVVPRPIALVTTQSEDGTVNAAPFSFFNIFSEAPALAMLGLERRRDTNAMKHTTRNIIATGELVINLVDVPLGKAMAACAADVPEGISELDFAGLTAKPSRTIAVPGIAEAPVRLECRLFEMRELTAHRHLCLAEILAVDVRDGLIDPDNLHVDLAGLDPLARYSGTSYGALREPFELPVPEWSEAGAEPAEAVEGAGPKSSS